MSSVPAHSNGLQRVAEDVSVLVYPLHLLGENHGRVVTVVKLSSGKLVIHSTAPFLTTDVAAIQGMGTPSWLVEASLLHDTFAKDGQAAFPALPYLAPDGFGDATGLPIQPLDPPPSEWSSEFEILEIAGMPKVREFAFFHAASHTLILGDIVMNFTHDDTTWEWLLRHYAMGLKGHPGVNRVFHAMVADKEAFAISIRKMLAWNFERVIVGHGEIYDIDAKKRTREALERAFPDLRF